MRSLRRCRQESGKLLCFQGVKNGRIAIDSSADGSTPIDGRSSVRPSPFAGAAWSWGVEHGRSDLTAVGRGQRLLVIAGPCVIESRELSLLIASRLKAIAEELGLQLVFKASFDKANRTSGDSSAAWGVSRRPGGACRSEKGHGPTGDYGYPFARAGGARGRGLRCAANSRISVPTNGPARRPRPNPAGPST